MQRILKHFENQDFQAGQAQHSIHAAALQVTLTLEEGEKNDVIFRLGACIQTLKTYRYLITQGRGKSAAREAFEKVKVELG